MSPSDESAFVVHVGDGGADVLRYLFETVGETLFVNGWFGKYSKVTDNGIANGVFFVLAVAISIIIR